jgi:heme-degrading monooxygenase HmoA
MHLRITAGHFQPGKMQESLTIMRELFTAYRQAGGFQNGYVAGDEQSGEGVAVTLWDSAEAAEAATKQTTQTLAKLAPLMASGQAPVPPQAHPVLLES